MTILLRNLGRISLKILLDKKRLHTSPSFAAKLFLDQENQHARDILVRDGKYHIFTEPSITPIQTTKDEELLNLLKDTEVTPSAVINDFKFIASYCKNTGTCISDERFDKFVGNFTSICNKFSKSQVVEALELLTLLPETEFPHTRNFKELWNALDDVCVDKAEECDLNEQLKIADAWCTLNLAKLSRYVWLIMKKAGRKIKKLTPSQLVHVMFFCNVTRKPVLGEMIDFEMNLKEIANQLTIDEIGVMAMGFFKTKTPLRDIRFIEYLYRRLEAEASTVKDITLVSLLKILRYSSKLDHILPMTSLLDSLCPEIERLSLLACTHVALIGCDMQISHAKSLEMIIERYLQDIEKARLKDMERLCHVISLSDFKTDSGIEIELMKKIIENLKTRTNEILRHPKCFSCLLHYLSLKGVYDEDMLSVVFDREFVEHAYGKTLILGREMFCLDSFVKIHLKDSYKGNFLKDKIVATMGRNLSRYIPEKGSKYKLCHADKNLLDIKEVAADTFGVATFKHILPHHERADVVLCYDKMKRRFIDVGKNCPGDYTGVIVTKDLLVDNPESITAIVLICGGWNNYVRNTRNPTGLLKHKIEQLKLLNYHPIPIAWFDWTSIQTSMEKKRYLEKRVNQLINSLNKS